MGEVEFGLILVGAFDDGVDDVGLTAGGDLFAEKGPDVVHTSVRSATGSDGGAAGWELVDDGGVEIAVHREGQGAGNGGRGHDEGVGLTRSSGLFAGGGFRFTHKAKALLHAEAMLLIDDDEPKIAEIDLVFDEGVGADGEVSGATGDAAAGFALGGGIERPGEQRDAVRLAGAGTDGRGEELAGGEIVLGGEDLCRCHESDLIAVFDGDEGGLDGDDGLARAHVALEEATHGLRPAHVSDDFAEDAFLRSGGVEGKDLLEGAADGVICNERSALSLAKAAALELEAKLKEEELLKDEAAVGRGRGGDEVQHGGAGLGKVDLAEGGEAGWEMQALQEGLGESFLVS